MPTNSRKWFVDTNVLLDIASDARGEFHDNAILFYEAVSFGRGLERCVLPALQELLRQGQGAGSNQVLYEYFHYR